MSDEKKKREAKDVPLGDGMADKAKKSLLGRARDIDSIVDHAAGTLQERDSKAAQDKETESED